MVRALTILVALSSIHAARSMAQAGGSAEQAVIVHFDYGRKDWATFFNFEKGFESDVSHSGLGNYDGNELAVDGSDGSMYLYGPDADKLFAFVQPRLLGASCLKNVVVTLRYGGVEDHHAREVKIQVQP
jgi:hypothetical protein